MYEIIIYPATGTAAAPEDHAKFTYYGLEIEGADWVDNILRDEMSWTIENATSGMADYRRILDRSDRMGEFRVTDVFDEEWIFEVVEH